MIPNFRMKIDSVRKWHLYSDMAVLVNVLFEKRESKGLPLLADHSNGK